jgi:hypothetical protein
MTIGGEEQAALNAARAVAGSILRWSVLWGPFFVMWVVFVRSYARLALQEALLRGSVAIGSAALLSVPVTAVSRQLPWPGKLRVSFYAAHLLLAVMYVAVWLAAIYGFDAWRTGTTLPALLGRSRVIGWQSLMGLWLYGLIAGLAYARNAYERAAFEERRAIVANALATDAKLEALRARLHPHFLFNALHALHGLIREDPAGAERGLERLGALLRYALSHDARALVPLHEEWHFTSEYLAFEHLRYGDRLLVEKSLQDDVRWWPTPPFALQTLVENAVRHAITAAAGGRIAISARQVDSQLELVVSDSGGSIADYVEHVPTATGLRTLRERLAAMYGGAWALDIAARPNGWTVTLRIPQLEED